MQEETPLPKLSDHRPDDRLLERYIAGECTLAEQAAMERWISANPAIGTPLRLLRQKGALESAWIHPDRPIEETMRQIVTAVGADGLDRATRLGEESLDLTALPGRGRGNNRDQGGITSLFTSRHWPFAAVVTAGAVGLALALMVRTSRTPNATAGAIARTYATTIGQRATVSLDDGTRVMLAPESRLDVGVFDRNHRTVRLVGEAYFDVRHTSGAPFIVRTGNTTTRVLGTAFDVQRYPTDRAVRVAVKTGRVVVGGPSAQHPSVTLIAGMTGLVSDSSAITVATSEAPYVGWIDGQLVFHKASTNDVLAVLTRWYGYRFRLADSSLAHQNLTLGLSTESSASAFATLKQVLDVDLRFDDSVVTLSPRRDSHAIPRASRSMPSDVSRDVSRVPHHGPPLSQPEAGR